MKAKRSSYSPRYEGNGCGGQMPPKKELSANTLPAKVPAEPISEALSPEINAAILRLLSLLHMDSAVKKGALSDVAQLVQMAAESKNVAEYNRAMMKFRRDANLFLLGDITADGAITP